MAYVYPAEFAPSENGGYVVLFKDFELATEGETLVDAMSMAEGALTLHISAIIRDGEDLPAPSNPKNLRPTEKDGFVSLVHTVWQEEEKIALAM